MKKALFILVAVAFSVNTFAQQGVQIGLIGGPSSNWLINQNNSDDANVREKISGPRGLVGLTVDYHFKPSVGVGLEFDYVWQGQAYEGPKGTTGLGYKANVNYLKIPLLLNFNSNPEDHVAMFVGKVGPYIGINTAAKGISDVAGTPTVDLKSNFRQVNAGMILGLGVGFNIAKVVVVTAMLRLDGQLTDAVIASPSTLYPEFFSYYNATGGVRSTTWNVSGALELGVKYVIDTGGGKSSHSSHGKSSYHRR